jgi:hypothetical protein
MRSGATCIQRGITLVQVLDYSRRMLNNKNSSCAPTNKYATSPTTGKKTCKNSPHNNSRKGRS